MQKKIVMLAGVLALTLASPWAGAQTVWRCGSSYSQQPCPGGSPVATSDGRTPAESAVASRVAVDDARRAEAMEKARLAQERDAPKAIVIGPQESRSGPVNSGSQGTKPKAGKLEQFTATAPRRPGETKGEKKKAEKKKAAKGNKAQG